MRRAPAERGDGIGIGIDNMNGIGSGIGKSLSLANEVESQGGSFYLPNGGLASSRPAVVSQHLGEAS